MGSPLEPILENAFLCHSEKQQLSEYAPVILPKVYKKYVDDIFVMFLCQSQLKDFLNYMNNTHPNIKFTFVGLAEFQKNNSFSFFDVKNTRSNSKLVTSVFCNATFSNVYINQGSTYLFEALL